MIKLLMVSLCLTTCLYCVHENFQSIEEVISKETDAIKLIPNSAHEELASMHTARGESYILIKQHERAIEDFENALFHAEYSNNLHLKWEIAFRAIFGKMVSFDQLAMQEQAEFAIKQLNILIDYFGCSYELEDIQLALARVPSANDFFVIPVEVDPNEPQPAWWCEKTVLNIMAVLRGIIINIRTASVQATATALVNKLEKKAISCCYAGGLWSACLKRLSDKFHQWNQKWKLYGIPPDPSWDSDLQ